MIVDRKVCVTLVGPIRRQDGANMILIGKKFKSTMVCALVLAVPASSFGLAYELIDLGPAPNATTSTAQAINDSGAIIFSSTFVLPNVGASLVQIPPFSGSTRAPSGSAINAGGLVVGDLRTTTAASTGRAFRYNPITGVTSNLGGIGERSEALDINSAGDTVGNGRSTSSSSSQRALLFPALGGVVNLATSGFIATEQSSATGISNSGQIVGWGRLTGATADQPLLFNGIGSATALPILSGDLNGRVFGINNVNRAVGQSSGLTANLRKAVEWDLTLNTITQYSAPGNIGGGFIATEINDSGRAIGSATQLGSIGRGVVYEGGIGYDIATRIVNNPVGQTTHSLLDINNAGEIVGSGTLNGQTRAFVLRPVTNFTTVNLSVTLQDLSPGPKERMISVDILDNGTVVQSRLLGLDELGQVSFLTNLTGTYDFRIRGLNTWLSKVVAGVSFTTGGTTPVATSLLNGDVNGDNEVGPADFSALSASFGLFNTDPGFNTEADLNKDLEVGPADFAILAASFGEFGE